MNQISIVARFNALVSEAERANTAQLSRGDGPPPPREAVLGQLLAFALDHDVGKILEVAAVAVNESSAPLAAQEIAAIRDSWYLSILRTAPPGGRPS